MLMEAFSIALSILDLSDKAFSLVPGSTEIKFNDDGSIEGILVSDGKKSHEKVVIIAGASLRGFIEAMVPSSL